MNTDLQFLLSLDAAVRPLVDASQITLTVATHLGRFLQVNRCAYVEIEPDTDTVTLTDDYNDGVSSIAGQYRLIDFGAECLTSLRAGRPYVVEDSQTDPNTCEVREWYRRTAIRAVICIPLLKDGRLIAAMAVHQNRPRAWQPAQVELVQLVASRCWESIERARVAGELQQLNATLEQQVELRTQALMQSERQFAQLVAGVTDCAIYMLDPNGCVASWNAGAARIKGYAPEEIIGRSFAEFYTPEDRQAGLPAKTLAVATAKGKFEGDGWRMRKDGSRFWASVLVDPIYDTQGRLLGYAKITRDMTDRRAMQEQLNQSQKMEAIGQLTGGVAHDFNNLLTVILGNLDTLSRRLATDDTKLRMAIEHASRGAVRAAALTQQLLAFSRNQPLNPQRTDVNQLITSLSDLIRRTLPEGILIETELSTGQWDAEVDANQLESALLNLAVNAKDAMPEGGRLTIRTENVNIDEARAAQFADFHAGDYVVISVSDTGRGMTPEILSRAFDPFFTTKAIGEGTGLGLSQVFGFVKQSGGTIRLYSEPGHGTTARIYLPRLTGELQEHKPERRREAPRAHHGETVLVVEDEADVRSYSADCLSELGFTVFAAAEGKTALDILAAQPQIGLLLTDVGLPGMNGRELAERARRLRPDLRVLFTSGYERNAIVHQGRLDAGVELLTKPFTRTQLADRIRRLLDRNPVIPAKAGT